MSALETDLELFPRAARDFAASMRQAGAKAYFLVYVEGFKPTWMVSTTGLHDDPSEAVKMLAGDMALFPAYAEREPQS